jgi:hypothetical protein
MSISNLLRPNLYDIYANSITANQFHADSYDVIGTADSTSPSTGSLVTQGGLGVVKSANIGNTLKIWSTQESTSPSTGSLVTLGGVGAAGDTFVGGMVMSGMGVFTDGRMRTFNTTQSTDPYTGALQIDGGVGVAKDVFIAGNTTILGTASVQHLIYEDQEHILSTLDSTDPTNGSSVVNGGEGIAKNLNVGGILKVWNTGQSTSPSTGSLVTLGGVGVTGNLYIGGTLGTSSPIDITSTSESTSTSTGSLVLGGGIGIAKNLNTGGILKVWNTTQSTDYLSGSLLTKGGMGIDGDISLSKNIYLNNPDGFIRFDKTIDTDRRKVVLAQYFENQNEWYGLGYNSYQMIHQVDSPSAKFSFLSATSPSNSKEIFKIGFSNTACQNTTDSTDPYTGSFTTQGGCGISRSLNVGGPVKVYDTTVSTDYNTGSLVTSAGAGIGGDVHMNGDLFLEGIGTTIVLGNIPDASQISSGDKLYLSPVGNATYMYGSVETEGRIDCTDITQSTSPSTGSVIAAGGLGISKDAYVGGVLHVQDTTPVTSSSTGSIIAQGGVSIVGDLRVGGTTESTNQNSGGVQVKGGLGVARNCNVGGLVKVFPTTPSTSQTTGALVVSGGLGVAKTISSGDIRVYYDATHFGNVAVNSAGWLNLSSSNNVTTISDQTTITNVTDTTLINDGALVCNGGVGVAKNLYVGGNLNVAGTTNITGGQNIVIVNSIADLPTPTGGYRILQGKKYLINTSITDTFPWQCSASTLSTDIEGVDENTVITYAGASNTALFNNNIASPNQGGWSFKYLCLSATPGSGTRLFNILGSSPLIPICMSYVKVIQADKIGVFGGISSVWLHMHGCFLTNFNQGMQFYGVDTNNRVSHSVNQVAIRGARNQPFTTFLEYHGYMDSIRLANFDFRTSGSNESIIYIDPNTTTGLTGGTFVCGTMSNSAGGNIFAGGSLDQTNQYWNFTTVEPIDDSKTVLYSYFNGNAQVTTGQASPPVKIAATWSLYYGERISQTNSNGIFTYVGIQPASLIIDVSLTCDPQSGADTVWAFYIFKNGIQEPQISYRTTIGTGAVAVVDFGGLVSNVAPSTTFEIYCTRVSGTSGLICTDGSISISHV